jgi:hypothetical protein
MVAVLAALQDFLRSLRHDSQKLDSNRIIV